MNPNLLYFGFHYSIMLLGKEDCIVGKIVETPRERITICTYKDLMKRFHEQSVKMNKSMSRRIEEFIISELEKENEKNGD